MMLASQLPEDGEDALLVLEATTRLVREFVSGPEPVKKPAPVIRLVDGSAVASG
jgi:hypothetical protein